MTIMYLGGETQFIRSFCVLKILENDEQLIQVIIQNIKKPQVDSGTVIWERLFLVYARVWLMSFFSQEQQQILIFKIKIPLLFMYRSGSYFQG